MFVDVVPRPRLGVPATSQLKVDFHVGLALADLCHLVDGAAALRAGDERDAVALGEGLRGKDDVGQSGDGRGLEQVDDHDEVELVQGLVQTLRVGAHAGDRVGGLQPCAMDLVRHAGFDRLHRLVGLRHREAEVVQRVVLDADALLFLHRTQDLAAPAACNREDFGGDDYAARALHVARDLPQGENRLASGHSLARHVDGDAPLQRGVLRVAEHAGRGDDLVLGDPGDLGDALDVELGGAGSEFIEAVTPFLDELVIV